MLGARNFAKNEREANDYYATEPKAVRLLLEVERFAPVIWECACGEGHLSEEIKKAGYEVYSSDLVGRGYGDVLDFLCATPAEENFDIITNPPFSKAVQFIMHAIDVLKDGHKAAMFLKIQFLESEQRRKLFDKYPPKRIYVASRRLRCAMNGDFERYKVPSAICYAWFVWEKGYNGDTVIKWIN